MPSVPLFEITYTVDNVTTTTSYGVGYGVFLIAFLYFLPSVVKFLLNRFYPKKGAFDNVTPELMLQLFKIATDILKPKNTCPSYFDDLRAFREGPNPLYKFDGDQNDIVMVAAPANKAENKAENEAENPENHDNPENNMVEFEIGNNKNKDD